MQQSIEERGDGRGVAEQLTPIVIASGISTSMKFGYISPHVHACISTSRGQGGQYECYECLVPVVSRVRLHFEMAG